MGERAMARRDFPRRMRTSRAKGVIGQRLGPEHHRNSLQCEGKVAMEFEEAKKVVRRQKRRKSQGGGAEVRVAYRCRYCQQWHVGTTAKFKEK